MQMKESAEREENLKKMNSSMIQAFKQTEESSEDSQLQMKRDEELKDLQSSLEKQKIEF